MSKCWSLSFRTYLILSRWSVLVNSSSHILDVDGAKVGFLSMGNADDMGLRLKLDFICFQIQIIYVTLKPKDLK